MKKLIEVLQKLYEETKERDKELVEYELPEKSELSSTVLSPVQFLERYRVAPLLYVGVTLSYELSEVQSGEQQLSTKSEKFGEGTVSNSNVLQFLRNFKQKATQFATDAPPTFLFSINWVPKSNPEDNYTLGVSVDNRSGELKIKDVASYEVTTKTQSVSALNKVSKFIKSNKKYIKNSPFRLLASVLVYNDWKYDWDIEAMQSDLPSREK